MLLFSSWANRFFVVTIILGIVTTGIGLAACPMQSLRLMHAFVILSTVTLVCVVVSIYLAPFSRVRIVGISFGPLALLWAFLLATYHTVSQIREAGARTQMTNNGKNIGLAAHDFHDRNRRLPSDLRNEAAVPLLSWRVDILPYIDQQPLWTQFNLKQAWDSPHNRPFVEKLPITYASILNHEWPGHTPWQGFVGPGTAFEPAKALTLAHDFPDGTSNTIFCVEAQQHVPWSKPSDIPYGPNIPLPPLGQSYWRRGDWPFCCYVRTEPKYYLVCMADATVRMFTTDIPEERLRALIVRNDGEPNDGWLPD